MGRAGLFVIDKTVIGASVGLVAPKLVDPGIDKGRGEWRDDKKNGLGTVILLIAQQSKIFIINICK